MNDWIGAMLDGRKRIRLADVDDEDGLCGLRASFGMIVGRVIGIGHGQVSGGGGRTGAVVDMEGRTSSNERSRRKPLKRYILMET